MTPSYLEHPHAMSMDSYFEKKMKNPTFKRQVAVEQAKIMIAQAVLKARKRAKLTQVQLAEKTGTSQSAIARLERGLDERVPTLNFLARIAFACDAHINVWFDYGKDKN